MVPIQFKVSKNMVPKIPHRNGSPVKDIRFCLVFMLLSIPCFGALHSSRPVAERLLTEIISLNANCDINVWNQDNLDYSSEIFLEQLLSNNVVGFKSTFSHVLHQISNNKSEMQRPRHQPVRKMQPCSFQLNFLFTRSQCPNNASESEAIGLSLSSSTSKLATDRFILITDCNAHARQLLLSTNVGLQMAFKMAVILSPGKTELVTSCLYCDNGNYRLVRISLSTKLVFDDTAQLNGAHLQISAPKIPPRLSLGSRPDGSIRFTRGLYRYLLEALESRYNITYSAFLSEKGAVGSYDPKKGFTGVMGDVIFGRGEIGVSIGYSYDRYPHVEYGSVLEAEYLTFSSGKRAPYTSWKALMWTFKPTMWLASWLAFVVSSGTLYLIAMFSTEDSHFHGIFPPSFYIFAAFLDQTASRVPSSNAARLLCSIWLLYSLVVSNAFREKLFGFLSFPLEIEIPESFQELATSHFKIGLQFYGGAAYKYIQTSSNPAFVKIASRMSLETDPIRCFTKTLEADFSCIHYHGAAEFVRARNLSDRHGRSNFVIAPASTLSLSISVVTKRDSVLMNQINNVIQPVRDMGLVGEWKKLDFTELLRKRVRWEMDTGIYRENVLEGDQHEHVQPLGMKQLLASFGMLLFGEIAAAVFVLNEIVPLRSLNIVINEMKCKLFRVFTMRGGS